MVVCEQIAVAFALSIARADVPISVVQSACSSRPPAVRHTHQVRTLLDERGPGLIIIILVVTSIIMIIIIRRRIILLLYSCYIIAIIIITVYLFMSIRDDV